MHHYTEMYDPIPVSFLHERGNVQNVLKIQDMCQKFCGALYIFEHLSTFLFQLAIQPFPKILK